MLFFAAATDFSLCTTNIRDVRLSQVIFNARVYKHVDDERVYIIRQISVCTLRQFGVNRCFRWTPYFRSNGNVLAFDSTRGMSHETVRT